MRVEELKKHWRRTPFRPFVVALENGELRYVAHPENLLVKDEICFWSDGADWSLFGPEEVTEITSIGARKKARK